MLALLASRVWVWCTIHYLVSAYLIVLAWNTFVRLRGSKWWADFEARHPRLAGISRVMKGLGIDLTPVLEGLVQAATGLLQQLAKANGMGQFSPPPPDPLPKVVVAAVAVIDAPVATKKDGAA